MKIGSSRRARTIPVGQAADVAEEGTPPANIKRKAETAIPPEDIRVRLARLADEALGSVPIDPGEPEADGIRLDRVKLAIERVKSGFYDRPEIKRKTAERLADEMLGGEGDEEDPPDHT